MDVLAYRASFTTNEHGLVNISIDTSNFTSSFISVLVSGKGHLGLKRHRSLGPQNLRVHGKQVNSGEKRKGDKTKVEIKQCGELNNKK